MTAMEERFLEQFIDVVRFAARELDRSLAEVGDDGRIDIEWWSGHVLHRYLVAMLGDDAREPDALEAVRETGACETERKA